MKELIEMKRDELFAWAEEAKRVIEGQLESSGDCRCGACKRARILLDLPQLDPDTRERAQEYND